MTRIIAAHQNRRERLARAKRIDWSGHSDMYSADLWLHTRTAVESGEPVVTVWFAGQSHTVPRTEAEDLLELIEASFISQQEAALVR